jgi:hypothetical protein
MLEEFIRLYPAIQTTIIALKELSNNEDYSFSKEEIKFLINCRDILELFVWPTNIFQAQSYTTISQAIPHINRIYIRLDEYIKEDTLVS